MSLPPKIPPRRVIDPIAEYDRLRPMLQAQHGEDWQHKYDRLYRELHRKEQFGKTFSKQYRRERAA